MWLVNKKVWSETYTVRTFDIDKEEKASVLSICRYLFDAAGNHADTLGLSVQASKVPNNPAKRVVSRLISRLWRMAI